MRRSSEFERFGIFELGTDRTFAMTLFSALTGNDEVTETDLVQMDLVEEHKGLPLSLQVRSCSVGELAANCRTITKELFKRWNLKEG